MTTKNPQNPKNPLAGRPLSIFFSEEHYDMYYFFPLEQNVKNIFVDGHRRKEQQKESNISKSIEKVKL